MINVFKNRTHLCALTTSVLFFLQGVDISGRASSLMKSPSYECKAETGDSQGQNPDRNPIVCDGTPLTIKGGSITARKYNDSAVKAEGGAVINVEGVSIDFGQDNTSASDSNLSVVKPVAFDDFGAAVFSDGSYESGTEINLDKSHIEAFFYGLRSEGQGKISMKNGSITETYIGAVANSESSISLDNVNIEVVGIGLWSNGKSPIIMKSGSIDFSSSGVSVTGIGVISTDMGFVRLDGVSITDGSITDEFDITTSSQAAKLSQEKEEGAIDSSVGPGRYVLLSGGGTISFNKGNINVSDTAVLLVDKSFQNTLSEYNTLNEHIEVDLEFLTGSEDGDIVGADGVVRKVYYINSRNHESEDLFTNINSTVFSEIMPFRDEVTEVLKAANREESLDILSLSTSVRSSVVKANGKRSYGIYFRDSDSGNSGNVLNFGGVAVSVEDDSYGDDSYKGEIRTVLLKGSRLRVPEGVAIYGDEGFGGYVIVKDDSTLSGGLLLKAEARSDLSVFVHDSVIAGAARIDKDSYAKLFLSGWSEWYLTEDIYSGFGNSDADCVDSCISSMRLADSNIRFFLSSKRKDGEGDQESRSNNKYRTLRIGNGSGTVYSAHGRSSIYFNADLMSGDADRGQVSDRLLIHGDVSGKTMVHVGLVSDGTSSEQQSKLNSVSIIQVYGNAKNDSFELDGGYVTLKGAPYKYVLHAYPPNSHQRSSSGPASKPFDPKLAKMNTPFWDYRLESASVSVASADAQSGEIPVITGTAQATSVVSDVSGTSHLGTSQPSSLARSEE
ncbi:hypothetical protein [Bartonella quintana]|nr:hypothetical protein [Bartonella quintana]